LRYPHICNVYHNIWERYNVFAFPKFRAATFLAVRNWLIPSKKRYHFTNFRSIIDSRVSKNGRPDDSGLQKFNIIIFRSRIPAGGKEKAVNPPYPRAIFTPLILEG